MKAEWPNEISPPYPTRRSSATAAMAKIIIRPARLSTWPPPANGATIGSAAKIRKMATGSASNLRRIGAGETESEAVGDISTAFRWEQPCRPNVEHDRHQQVDQHRGDGRTDGARGRRAHDEA